MVSLFAQAPRLRGDVDKAGGMAVPAMNALVLAFSRAARPCHAATSEVSEHCPGQMNESDPGRGDAQHQKVQASQAAQRQHEHEVASRRVITNTPRSLQLL
jgi:hypothetical protein